MNILYILLAVLILLFMITVHELGHYMFRTVYNSNYPSEYDTVIETAKDFPEDEYKRYPGFNWTAQAKIPETKNGEYKVEFLFDRNSCF